MSYQLEVMQTCVSSFMMGLMNHKSMPKKLAKKCKIFDYLCKKFPLDQVHLENYSRSIAFNSTFEVEKKFIQDNLLDLLIFNKCISMDSSVAQLSNSNSTTALDSSAECMSPYLLKIKNNYFNSNQPSNSSNQSGKGDPTCGKQTTNIHDKSCSSSGGLLFQSAPQGQVSFTSATTSVTAGNKIIENSSKPPLPAVNQVYGLSSLQPPISNLTVQGITTANANIADSSKKQTLTSLQSPSANSNPYQIPQMQNFQAMHTPNGGNSNSNTSIQDDINVNQFSLGSSKKVHTVPSISVSNANSSSKQNNMYTSNKQGNNNFYYPIKPINFNMTMQANNKEQQQPQQQYNSANNFDNSIYNSINTSVSNNNKLNSNNNLNNLNMNQQFNNTLFNMSQKDLVMKTNEKANGFNQSNLLSKIRGTIATFKEGTQMISSIIQSSSVTESHVTPNMLASAKSPATQTPNALHPYSNPIIAGTNQGMQNYPAGSKGNVQPHMMNGIRQQTDVKRKSYMLKNMSIYQQNRNLIAKQVNV